MYTTRQWLDNAIINYANIDPNIPRGSRVMSIFTNCPQLAEMMLNNPSSIKCGFACQYFGYVDMHMQNVIKIYYVIQEL